MYPFDVTPKEQGQLRAFVKSNCTDPTESRINATMKRAYKDIALTSTPTGLPLSGGGVFDIFRSQPSTHFGDEATGLTRVFYNVGPHTLMLGKRIDGDDPGRHSEVRELLDSTGKRVAAVKITRRSVMLSRPCDREDWESEHAELVKMHSGMSIRDFVTLECSYPPPKAAVNAMKEAFLANRAGEHGVFPCFQTLRREGVEEAVRDALRPPTAFDVLVRKAAKEAAEKYGDKREKMRLKNDVCAVGRVTWMYNPARRRLQAHPSIIMGVADGGVMDKFQFRHDDTSSLLINLLEYLGKKSGILYVDAHLNNVMIQSDRPVLVDFDPNFTHEVVLNGSDKVGDAIGATNVLFLGLHHPFAIDPVAKWFGDKKGRVDLLPTDEEMAEYTGNDNWIRDILRRLTRRYFKKLPLLDRLALYRILWTSFGRKPSKDKSTLREVYERIILAYAKRQKDNATAAVLLVRSLDKMRSAESRVELLSKQLKDARNDVRQSRRDKRSAQRSARRAKRNLDWHDKHRTTTEWGASADAEETIEKEQGKSPSISEIKKTAEKAWLRVTPKDDSSWKF